MKLNSILSYSIVAITLSVALWGCKATDDLSSSSSGSTTVTFTKSTDLGISYSSTATELLFGKFTTDSYPDVVLLSNLGADYYKNVSGTSWQARVNLDTGTAFTHGVALNLSTSDSNNLADLVLSSSTGLYTLMNTGASGGFASSTISSVFALSAQPVQSLAYVTTSTTGTGFAIVGSSASQHSWVGQTNGTLAVETAASGSDAGLLESGVKVFTADINGDGKNDFVLIPRTGSVPIEFWINSADTSFTINGVTISPASTHTIQAATVADVNGDGKPDIVLATDAGLELYLNSTASTSSISFTTSTALDDFTGDFSAVVVADFTGNGKADIFAAKTSSTGILLSQTASSPLTFRNITSTSFGSDLPSGPIRVYAVDLDNDGKIDLVELKSDGTVTTHLNSGS